MSMPARSLASQRLARDVARSKATPPTRRCLAFMGRSPEGHVAILTDGNDAVRLVGVRAVEEILYSESAVAGVSQSKGEGRT